MIHICCFPVIFFLPYSILVSIFFCERQEKKIKLMRKIQKHSSDLFPTHEFFSLSCVCDRKSFFSLFKNFFSTHTYTFYFLIRFSNFSNCNRKFFLGNVRQLLLIFWGCKQQRDTKKSRIKVLLNTCRSHKKKERTIVKKFVIKKFISGIFFNFHENLSHQNVDKLIVRLKVSKS